MSSTAKTLVKGSALRIFAFFVNCVVALALTPFILNSLGDRMYGLWILLGTFLGFYGIFDLGLASSIQRFVSRSIGTRDYDDTNRIINTSLFLYLLIGLVVLFVAVLVAVVTPFFAKHIVDISLFRKIVLILGFSTAVGFPMRVFSGILISHLRYDLVTSIELLKLLIRTALVVVFLKMGHGILALAIITFAVETFEYLITYLTSKQIAHYIILSKNFINKASIKSLFEFGISVFIANIAEYLRFYVDNFVIAAFLGLTYVTVYSIGSRLIIYFRHLMVSALGIMMPIFSQYEGRDDYKNIREKYIFTIKLSVYISMLVGGLLIIFGRKFIVLWVGERFLKSYTILVILAVATIFDSMQGTKVSLLQGLSRHRFYAVSNFAEGIANLALSILLVIRLGIIGVALGTAIPMVINKVFVQPLYISKVIGYDIKKLYGRVIFPAIAKSFTVISIIGWLASYSTVTSYSGIVFLSSVGCALFLFMVFFVGLSNIERVYLKRQLWGS